MADTNYILVTMSSRSRCLMFQRMCKSEDDAECFCSDIITEYPDDEWTWIYNHLTDLSKISVYNPIEDGWNVNESA